MSVAVSVSTVESDLGSLSGWSRDARIEQRWRTPSGVPVDILPVTPDALARGYFDWPISGRRMSLVGIRLAFEHAVTIAPAEDLAVRVAPPNVLAVLKIIAYLDRPEEREKDLGDLAHMMHDYLSPDSERRFADEVPEEVTEYEDVAPFLLGRDVTSVVNVEERARVIDFLIAASDDVRGPRLLHQLARLGPYAWRDPGVMLQRILALRSGIGA